MSLKIGSLNCRGLLTHSTQVYISKLISENQLDVLFLQETNVNCLSKAKSIETYFKAKAIWSFSSQKCTGVAILFFSETIKIDFLKFDLDGRLILVDISVSDQKFRFINVYAPADDNNRVTFLSDIYMYLSTSRKIILGGDFNCILNAKHDKVGGNPKRGLIGSKEIISLCSDFNLIDPYRSKYPNSITTTRHSLDVHTRLDHFYISKSLDKYVSNVLVIPCSRNVSDHDLITFTMSLDRDRNCIQLGQGYWKCNNSVLHDRSFIRAFTSFWKAKSEFLVITLESWDKLKLEIKNFIIDYCKKKSRISHRVIISMRKRYSALQKYSNQDDYIDQINNLRNQISELESRLIRGVIIRSKCDILSHSEKPSKFFVVKERKAAEKKIISKLEVGDQVLSNHSSIINAFRDFYINLYTEEPIDISLMNDFLTDFPKLDTTLSDQCEGPITLDEIIYALKNMQNNKSPGPDGLTKEFYQSFSHLLFPVLVQLYKIISDSGILTESQRLSYITLICKDPDHSEQLKTWRPISLLNYDYKILSKIITNRLSNVMENLIHPDQASGVRTRSILDNAHLLRNICDYVSQKNIACAWINLDFEKAYDRVNMNFLFSVLKSAGFGPSFINWVKILYNQISSSVLVNNHISEPFNLSRGLRQGCSLSPLLFVLCLEPLAIKVRSSANISGLTLPGTTIAVKQIMYADDVTGVFTTNLGMKSFMSIVINFCKASGSKINFTKTNGLFLGKWKSRSDHPFGISWPDEVKLIGLHFGYNVTFDDIWHPIFLKFEKVINLWKMRHLTLKQKAIVLNMYACSKIWYVGAVLLMPKAYVRLFQKTIWKFLWPKANYEPIKRMTLLLPFKEGGLNVIDIESKLLAFQIKHLGNYISNPKTNWGRFSAYWCAFQLRKYDINLWSNSCPHSMSQSTFYKNALKALSIISATNPDFDFVHNPIKAIYSFFVKLKTVKPRCIRIFPQIDFKQAFENLHNTFIEPASRDICYRLIMQVLPVNYVIHTIFSRPASFSYCTFCNNQQETFEHLFYYCPTILSLKKFLAGLLSKFDKQLKWEMVYFLQVKEKNKHVKSLLLYLISLYINTIWTSRNLIKYDKKKLTAHTLILIYMAKIKFRIECDFERLSIESFVKYWCQTNFFCTLNGEEKLCINFNVN